MTGRSLVARIADGSATNDSRAQIYCAWRSHRSSRRQFNIGTLTTGQAEQALANVLDLPVLVYPTAPLLA